MVPILLRLAFGCAHSDFCVFSFPIPLTGLLVLQQAWSPIFLMELLHVNWMLQPPRSGDGIQVFSSSLRARQTYMLCPLFFKKHATPCWFYFCRLNAWHTWLASWSSKEIATHSWGCQVLTLILCATLVRLIRVRFNSLIPVMFLGGMITRLEIVAIILILKSWTNDVPSVYHAFRLRKGATGKSETNFH